MALDDGPMLPAQDNRDFSDILDDAPKPQTSSGGPSGASTGTILSVTIVTSDWEGNGSINCGSFEVCGMKIEGPPSTATIEGVSVPMTHPVRREMHTRGWEDTTLRDIAADVAARGGLTLMWELDDNPQLDRVDQRQRSDLSFLNTLVKDHGASVKVINNRLVVFSEEKYEAKPPSMTFKKGDGQLLSYSFTQDTSDCSEKAEVMLKDPKSGKYVNEVFDPPSAPAVGNDLIVNARVPHMGDDRHRRLSGGRPAP